MFYGYNRFNNKNSGVGYSPLLNNQAFMPFTPTANTMVPSLQYAQAQPKQAGGMGNIMGGVGKLLGEEDTSIDPQNIQLGEIDPNLPWLKDSGKSQSPSPAGLMSVGDAGSSGFDMSQLMAMFSKGGGFI